MDPKILVPFVEILTFFYKLPSLPCKKLGGGKRRGEK
jgi:hypothetical protein